MRDCFVVPFNEETGFLAQAEILLHGKNYLCPFRIATGCEYSIVLMSSLIKSEHKDGMIYDYKREAIDYGLKCVIRNSDLYGLPPDFEYEFAMKNDVTKRKALKSKSARFVHKDVNISFADCKIQHDIEVNYDYEGVSVLGMDILKDFRIHGGVSQITNNFVMILGKNGVDGNDFEKLVREHFGYLVK